MKVKVMKKSNTRVVSRNRKRKRKKKDQEKDKLFFLFFIQSDGSSCCLMSAREGGPKVEVRETSAEACKYVAAQIAKTIREKVAKKGRCVLGLATGATQIPVYQELVRLHKVRIRHKLWKLVKQKEDGLMKSLCGG